ncbi:PREDICTED: uncharacterized protein LOC105556572, partial [Vollenhovia emeryi]|uniref:uncharacterized protein LOC105556572 n=1 Tax=Vollenhovia emeryi TaxID=411798 RepID=UPI0005F5464A
RPEGIKNIRTAILRGIPVEDDWIKYKCDIISKHIIYELALQAEKTAVASSESENERQLGKRKVKHSKYKHDYVDYVGPPRLVSSCKKSSDTSTTIAETLEQFDNQNPELDHATQNDENDILTDINNAPVIIAERTDDFMDEFKQTMKDIKSELESMKNKQEQSLSQIQETVNMILAKMNYEQYRREDPMKDDKIRKYLPLTSIENFLELEDVLKIDDEALTQVVDKVLLIGGKNEKDFIRRTLSAMFSDNLAVMCSWTGQKDNFKVGDTYIIIGIKNSTQTF